MVSLEKDMLDENGLRTEIIDDPTDAELLKALEDLDGDHRTQIWLHLSSGSHMQVVGPANGRYSIDYSGSDGKYCYAVDSSQPEGVTAVAAGDDWVEIEQRGLIELRLVRRALVEFLSTQQLSREVVWYEPNQ